jgi:glycosyltransferase involved in cell wall biosynthesis
MYKSKKKIKILYFTHSSELSGGERSLLGILENLDKSTYEPILVTPVDGPLPQAVRLLGVKWVELDVSKELLKRRRSDIRPYSKAFFSDAITTTVSAGKLKRIIREEGIDLIHSNSMKAHFISALAAHRSDTPLVCHVRDILSDRYARSITDLFLGTFADRIIAVSDAVAKQFNLAKPRVRVIYNGIDVDKLAGEVAMKDPHAAFRSLCLPSSTRIVANIGQLSSWKGQYIFVRAAKKILKRVPDTYFLVVGGALFGGNGYVEFLKKLANDLGIRERIHFVGQTEGITEVLMVADVLLHTPVKPEPFGRVIVEAMASGVPVVASRCGGIPEIIKHGENGLLVEPKNVSEAADAVCELLLNKGKADNIVKAAKRRAADFNVRSTVNQIEGLYEEMALREEKKRDEYAVLYAFSYESDV